MIFYLKGKIEEINLDFAVIEVNNVGYQVFLSEFSLRKLSLNQEVKIHIYMNVKEDGIILYGFLDDSEKRFFEKLISVSKIGPKSAMAILSFHDIKNLPEYIINKNSKAISKFPGIGLKTAERIILELKDKLDGFYLEPNLINNSYKNFDIKKEALEALESLGYSTIDAKVAIENINADTVEETIKQALKSLSIF